MATYEWLALAARVLTYAGSIGAAGSILLAVTLGPNQPFLNLLRWQSLAGSFVLILALPLTYLAFQLGLVGGDGTLAFSEGFRGIYFQTGQGTLAFWRLGLASVLILMALFLGISRNYGMLALIPAIALVALFGFEGHSTTFGPRWASAALIITHLAIVHWWFAVLVPLLLTSTATQAMIAPKFSIQAIWAVPVLVIAGSLFLGILADWQWPEFEGYFVRFAWKIGAFVLILGLAAINKYWAPPGRTLRQSIGVETVMALSLLVLTSFLVKTSP
ncbi:MAG: hypothetical protein ACPGRH_02200 [Alphaproteobacteria bacterium]